MRIKSLKLLVSVILVCLTGLLVCEGIYAESAAPSVKLIPNPNNTEVSAGSKKIALIAIASGTNLK